MREYNSISKLIKELLHKTQTTVINNFSRFLFLGSAGGAEPFNSRPEITPEHV